MDDEPIQPPSHQPKRFFDIAAPKDFRPSSTSRPLIVGHHPEQPDPMMTALPEPPQPETAVIPTVPKREAPPAAQPAPAPGTAAVVPAEPEPATQTPETMMQEEYEEIEHELPSGAVAHPVQPVKTMVAGDTIAPTTAGTPVVVHHNHHPHPFAKKLLTVVIVVVLLAVASDVLLDANIWKPTHHFPHTHFIN